MLRKNQTEDIKLLVHLSFYDFHVARREKDKQMITIFLKKKKCF